MTILAVVGMAREAQIAAGEGVRVAVGAGRPQVLQHALDLAAGDDLTGVISLGICGALAPGLAVGDVVIGTGVVAAQGVWRTDQAWSDRLADALPQAQLLQAWGSDAMVIEAVEKARLRQATGCAVVDMESHLAARFAEVRGLPFAVLRVVSDAAETSLPRAVLDGLKPDGRPNLPGVLLGLAKRPGQLPALIRLGRDSELALKVLTETWALARPALS